MIFYYYDGSFEGLLTAIYEAYYRRESPTIMPEQKNIQLQLFSTNVKIETSEEKASKVYEAIHKKISYNVLKNVYHAYLSENEGISQHIFKYLKLAFKVGKKVDYHLTDENVLAVHNAAKSVQRERHLILGILRFKCLHEDLYYASYEPDHNITALLVSHFSKRLSNQCWIIHDVKRNIAAVYNKNNCIITDLPGEISGQSMVKTDEYETLFKEFFESICIKERINPKLQKRFLPKRYWKHLVEMSQEANS